MGYGVDGDAWTMQWCNKLGDWRMFPSAGEIYSMSLSRLVVLVDVYLREFYGIPKM